MRVVFKLVLDITGKFDTENVPIVGYSRKGNELQKGGRVRLWFKFTLVIPEVIMKSKNKVVLAFKIFFLINLNVGAIQLFNLLQRGY